MWGALAGAALSIGSNLLQGSAQKKAATKANEFSANQVAKQMEFQERMSNTSYQRGMKDMRKAGLNPILAFKQGGASTPSGGAATGQIAKTTGLSQGVVNSAVQAYTAKVNTENTAANTELVKEKVQSEKVKDYVKKKALKYGDNTVSTAVEKTISYLEKLINSPKSTPKQKIAAKQKLKKVTRQYKPRTRAEMMRKVHIAELSRHKKFK